MELLGCEVRLEGGELLVRCVQERGAHLGGSRYTGGGGELSPPHFDVQQMTETRQLPLGSG